MVDLRYYSLHSKKKTLSQQRGMSYPPHLFTHGFVVCGCWAPLIYKNLPGFDPGR